MNHRALITLLFLISTCSFAGGNKAYSECLMRSDAKDCLASLAAAALTTDKSAESRIHGYAYLLSSLAKAGIRRDDILTSASDDPTAPIDARWSLLMARRSYALKFGLDQGAFPEVSRLEGLADLLRKRRDGIDRLTVIWSACEAREGESIKVIDAWEGMLDRQCRIDDADAEAMEKGMPGLSVLAASVVDAYNHDEKALKRSVVISFRVLSEYEQMLNRTLSNKEREGIRGALAIGHMLTATALAIDGRAADADRVTDISIDHLNKISSIDKIAEFHLLRAQGSWIYAKAKMRDKAMAALRNSLATLDKSRNLPAGDKAVVIATCIETLRTLEAQL